MPDKMYFGVPGAIKEIRYPESGMGFSNNLDTDETALINGGRSFYRAPNTYKRFNLTWKGGSYGLRHLIDCYNGQFGSGPYYLTDPTADPVNVLPARWSASWQLAHRANGWCKPVIQDIAVPQTPDLNRPQVSKKVVFTQALTGASIPTSGIVRTRVIRMPGQAYWLTAYGAATGGAGIKVRGYNATTNAWTDITTFTTFTGTTTNVLSTANTSYSMIELDLYLPLGSTLELQGVCLGYLNYRTPGNVLNTNMAMNSRGLGGQNNYWATSPGTGGAATVFGYDTVYPYRKNFSPNPEATSATFFGSYITGSGETVTTSYLTGQSDGPLPQITGYGRVSITAQKTGNSTGWASTSGVQRAPLTGASGEQVTVSLYLRYTGTGTLTGTFRGITYTAAGTQLNTADSAPVTLVSGVWTRVNATVTATGDFASIGWWFYNLSAQIAPTGSTIDATGTLIEKTNVLGTYFDGNSPTNGNYSYIWEGTANASISQERLPAIGPDGNLGFIQYRQTTAATGGSVGPYLRDTSGLNGGVAGDKRYVRAWVRVSNTRQVSVSFAFKDSANIDVGSVIVTPTVTLSPGSWYLFESGPLTAAGAFTRFQTWARTVASAGVQVTQEFTYDIVVQVTDKPVDYYFDGSTPNTAYKFYSWAGAYGISQGLETDHEPYEWMPQGQGTGPLQFTSTQDGSLVSAIIDRVGLSVDLTEVQSVESRVM